MVKQNETKFDKKTFEEVVTSMLKGFDKETMSTGLYNHLIENAEWFKEPETISTFITHPVKNCAELIIQNVHKKSREVANIWLDYDFIESNVSKLCEQFYGSGCSVDRGRFIVKSFIKFTETKVMPEFNWKQEYTYHYPEKGTMKQWVDFADGVFELRYGLNKKYLKALKSLVDPHSSKLNDGNDGIPSEPKDLGILPTII
jgi:hypothetical protein